MRLPPDYFRPDSVQPPRRRFQISVRMLIVLVLVSGTADWATRPFWDPVLITVDKLHDSSPTERTDALSKLTRIGHGRYETVIPPITLALVDLEPSVRIAAAEALASLGSDAWASRSNRGLNADIAVALRGALNDPESSVRKAAVENLGTLVALKGVDGAIDRDAALRDIAAALAAPRTQADPARINSDAIMSAFTSIIANPHDQRRPAVLKALALNHVAERFAPPEELAVIFREPSAVDRAAAVQTLGGFDRPLDPWIPTLFRLLEHDRPEVQGACASVLDRISPPVVSPSSLPVLVDALKSKNSAVRLHAARALRSLVKDARTAVAIPTLLEIVRQSLATVKGAGEQRSNFPASEVKASIEIAVPVLWVLGEVSPPTDLAAEAMTVLAGAVRCEIPELRSEAASALRKFNGAALHPLITLLDDPRPSVRLVGAQSLDFRFIPLPPDADWPAIFTALAAKIGDDDTEVRIAVLEALVHVVLGLEVEPPAALAECLDDKSRRMRTAAIAALAHFRCGLDRWLPSILTALEQAPEDRINDVERVICNAKPLRLSVKSVLTLVDGLRSHHRAVRCFAARQLGAFGPDVVRAVPELIEALAYPLNTQVIGLGKLDNAIDFDAGRAIIEALARIAPATPAAPDAVRALIRIMQDTRSSLSVSAICALKQFGTEALPAVPLLVGIIKENTGSGESCTDMAVAAGTAVAAIAPRTPAAAEVVALLTGALESASPDTRANAIAALTAFGPEAKSALPRLRELQSNSDSAIRVTVAKAIAVIDFGE
jgi:HEAT repeat protein